MRQHGQLVDFKTIGAQLGHGLPERGRHGRVGVLRGLAFDQEGGAGLERAGLHPAEQHPRIEGQHQVGLVTSVAHLLAAQTQAQATGARGRDLCRPQAVAHAQGNRRQALAAAQGAVIGIAHDLDDVPFQRGGHAGWRRGRAHGGGGGVHGVSSGEVNAGEAALCAGNAEGPV